MRALISAAFVVLLAIVRAAPTPLCGTEQERFDALCNGGRAKALCVVTGNVSLPPDWLKCTWASEGGLELRKGASLTCASRSSRWDNSATCELHLAFATGIKLGPSSSILGGTVVLESARGAVIVAAGAGVSTTGRGVCGGSSSVSVHDRFLRRIGLGNSGAGHGGDGGSCNGPGGRPGEYDRKGGAYGDALQPESLAANSWWWHADEREADAAPLYGAGSSTQLSRQTAPEQCCGGGLILINASGGLELNGLLEANAQRPCHVCNPINQVAATPWQSRAGGADAGGGGTGARARAHNHTGREGIGAAGGGGGRVKPGLLPCCDATIVMPGQPCTGLGGAAGGTIVVLSGRKTLVPLNGTGSVSAQGGDVGAHHARTRQPLHSQSPSPRCRRPPPPAPPPPSAPTIAPPSAPTVRPHRPPPTIAPPLPVILPPPPLAARCPRVDASALT